MPGAATASWKAAACLLFLGFLPSSSAQPAVTTHHNDTLRTGQNLNETILNTTNVNVNTFGKLFSRAVDGQIYAQPLYMPALSIAGTTRNVVFVATQNNSVYAFDADDPAESIPLWQVNFGTPVPSTDVDPACADITPQIGITSTPVIDTSTGTLYVVAKTKNTADSSYHFHIHALDLFTGLEKFAGPAEITAQVPGSGSQSVAGIVTFDPLQQFQRPGLLLLNGVVYVAFGSACEIEPWHGWIVGYNASTLQQVAVLNTTPNGTDGGIWGGGQGLVADTGGNIYVMTGNGTFETTAPTDYGNSVLKIGTASGLSIVDYFTPKNFASLNSVDLDLGSGGPLALPGTSLIVGSGKDNIVRVLNTANLGQFNATFNNDVQEFKGTAGFVFMGAPIYWNTPNHGPVIYIWSGGDFLKAYQFTNGKFVTTPVSQSTVQEAVGYSNSVPLSLSSNGSQAGTGIVWASGAFSANANTQTVTGILRAFDATNLTSLLWDSKQNAARDDVGNYAKFSPPTVANGKVYLSTFSNQLLVYGLLPDFAISGSPGSASIVAGQPATYTVTVQPLNSFTGSVTLACSGLPTGAACSFNPATITAGGGGGATTSVLTVSTTSLTPAADSTLTVASTSGALAHSTTLSLSVTDFSVGGAPGSATIVAGQPASYTVTVQPLNNFTGSVVLACSGLPAAAACLFNPATVALAGAPVTSALTVTTQPTTPAANSTLTISSTFGSATHSATVSLAVTDFTLSTPAASMTVRAGQSAVYTLNLQAQNGFSGSVSLACTGLPAKSACSFSPAPVTLAANAASSTLTITTTAPSMAGIPPGPGRLYAAWLPLSGLGLVGLSLLRFPKRYRSKILPCLLLLGLTLVEVRCGGTSASTPPPPPVPGTTPGTYSITVSGTSGVQHSTTLTLTVQ